MRPRVVIIGSGFGGIYSYKSLLREFRGDVDITIISKTDHFLFTPMLHEAATLGVSDTHLVEPVTSIIRNTDTFIQGEVTNVNPQAKQLTVNEDTISFDYLIVSAGSRTNYAGVPGAQQNSLPLKTYADVVALRSRILEMFSEESPPSDTDLSFVVVGGGGTGVEMAAELTELIHSTLRSHFGRDKTNRSEVTLIHRGLELVKDFDPPLRVRISEILKQKGIRVLTGASVTEVTPSEVILSDGRKVKAGSVIWTAGVTPVDVGMPKNLLTESGMIKVGENLSVPEYPYIFAIGDIAHKHGHRRLPLRAQVASKQGTAIGEIINEWHTNKTIVPFEYKSSGELVSVGQWYAVGSIRGQAVSGSVAWYIRRTVYLLKMISFWKKLKVSLDWTVRIFYHRELISRD